MKLIFFLVAFLLVSTRVYFSWSGKDKERRGIAETNMVVTSDHFREEMKYAGRFQLTEDETAFKSISPGGYFKWKRNEQTVKAESNLQGTIEYSLFDGKNNLSLEVNGKRLLTEALKEMVYWGFDAEARMERIFKKGGDSALLSQVDSMKTDQLKLMYLNRLMTADSLSPEKIAMITLKIGALGSDYDKAGVIQYIVNHDSLSDENIRTIIGISGRLGSDMDKMNIFSSMIDKGLISGSCYTDLLNQVSNLGSDMDKANLYTKLSMSPQITEAQWISMLNYMSQLESDIDKANLLIIVVQKMPKTPLLKETYLAAAKTIHNDNDYGRAIRAVE